MNTSYFTTHKGSWRGALTTLPALFCLMTSIFLSNTSEAVSIPQELGPAEFPTDVVESFANHPAGGVITAIKGAVRHRASRLQLTYYKLVDEPLDIEILFANYTDREVAYTVYFLVDYVQSPFKVAGTRYDSYVVSISPPIGKLSKPKSVSEILAHGIGAPTPERSEKKSQIPMLEQRVFPVSLTGISEGAHDVLMIAVPRVPSSGDDQRGGNLPPIVTQRFNVIVGSTRFPEITSVQIGTNAIVGADSQRAQADEAHFSYDGGLWRKGAPEGAVRSVEITNRTNSSSTFAITAAGSFGTTDCGLIQPRFISVAANEKVLFDDSGIAQCIHRHEGVIIVAQSPFSTLEKPHGTIVEGHYSVDIFVR